MTDKRVFIERRPERGDYAVRRPNLERACAILPTQREAIDRARQRGGDVFVERVRDTNRGDPDKWRRPDSLAASGLATLEALAAGSEPPR
jgi:Uncharacterized protein conserved in bacteria (DUF2188)